MQLSQRTNRVTGVHDRCTLKASLCKFSVQFWLARFQQSAEDEGIGNETLHVWIVIATQIVLEKRNQQPECPRGGMRQSGRFEMLIGRVCLRLGFHVE